MGGSVLSEPAVRDLALIQSQPVDQCAPVVVIGASVAGLFAAQQLAHAKVPVHLYERTDPPAMRARTLIVTPQLHRALGFSVDAATVNTVHTLELHSKHRSVAIALREPDLIVERTALMRMLAARAHAAGVRLAYGHEFADLDADGDLASVVVRRRGSDRTERVAARAVLAGDGVRSHVARRVGAPPQPTVTVLQARVSVPRAADPGVGKVWFLPNDTPYFYWLCPESRHTAAVGIVDDKPRHARAKLDRFLAGQGLQPLEYQSALIPLYTPRASLSHRVGGTDVLFVGDAAGHVKTTTVGGTVTGVRGAYAAASAIARRTDYARELRTVERELRLHWRIRSLMNRFRDAEYDILLQVFAGRVGRLLEIHNRDSLEQVFWWMLAMQPRLPLLAAHMLWRMR
jgi:digeranylgeranylglycerophospholipid reductase